MTRGQEAPKQIETVHCLVVNRVYFLRMNIIFISSREAKMYISFVASHFGMNMHDFSCLHHRGRFNVFLIHFIIYILGT